MIARCPILSTIAVALGLAASAPADESRSWKGVVVTEDDREFEGQLLFDNTRLIVNPGEPSETTVAFDQIYKLKFQDTGNAGNRPPAERTFENGLFAEYYGGKNLDGHRQGRIDPSIDFRWGHGVPMEGIPADQFSVRWSGEVQAPISGKVTFHLISDDGSRLFIGGSAVVDAWTDHAAREFRGEVEMEAGKRYPIRVEYYDTLLHASMRLMWSGPGLGKQVVPASHLFTDGAAGSFGSGKQKIWLRGGSKLRGTVVGLDEKFVDFSVEGGRIRLPIASLAVVDLLGWWDTAKELEGRPEGVLLRNEGEFHAADIKEVDAEDNLVTFSPLLGKRLYKVPDIRALKFGKLEDKPAALKIRTGSWSWDIRADAVFSRGERLIVRDNSGQFISLPLAVIFQIEAHPGEE